MKKFMISTIAFLVSLLNIFSFPSQVNAAEKVSSELDFENFELVESLSQEEVESLESEVTKLNQDNNYIQTQANQTEIDFSNPNYTKLVHKDTQDTFYTVSFDIIGSNHELSSLDIIYDKTLDIQYQKEIHIKDYNGSDVSLTTWFNNEQVVNVEDTKQNLENKAETQIQNERDGVTTYASGGWSCISDCLSNAGISMWLIGLIGTACAGVCLVSAGTGCAPCLVGLGMTQIQVFFNCDDKCNGPDLPI